MSETYTYGHKNNMRLFSVKSLMLPPIWHYPLEEKHRSSLLSLLTSLLSPRSSIFVWRTTASTPPTSMADPPLSSSSYSYSPPLALLRFQDWTPSWPTNSGSTQKLRTTLSDLSHPLSNGLSPQLHLLSTSPLSLSLYCLSPSPSPSTSASSAIRSLPPPPPLSPPSYQPPWLETTFTWSLLLLIPPPITALLSLTLSTSTLPSLPLPSPHAWIRPWNPQSPPQPLPSDLSSSPSPTVRSMRL